MTSPTRYGPHQPEAAPNAVTVLGSGKFPAPELRPIPAPLVKQRRDANELARQRAAGEGWMHDCSFRRGEVWVPGTMRCPLCMSEPAL